MNKFKLGKLAPKHDSRTLKFKSYFDKLPPIPTAVDWTPKVADWKMLANDEVGDCTIAAAGHLEMLWTSQTSTEYIPTDAETLAAYTAITGYNPQDPNSDNGAVELDVLNYWRNTGFGSRPPILAYMQINPTVIDHVKASIALFGGCYVGIQVPASAQDDFSNGLPWTNTNDNNIEGGHAIILVAYDQNYVTCVTWGALQKISYPWLAKYMEEAYAVLSPDWIAANGSAPSTFNLAQLQADLKLIS
jgi:hypothetical protein